MAGLGETLFDARTVLLRRMTLAAGEIGRWHRHSTQAETVIAIDGFLQLQSDGESVPRRLGPGDQGHVAAGHPHRLINPGDAPVQYLLAQSGGAYDFIEVDPTR